MIKTQSIHGGARHPVASMGTHIIMPRMEAPRRNRLLAALPRDEYHRLRPGLEPFPLRSGASVRAAAGQQQYLYFITAGVISRWCTTEEGKTAEFASTGSEGVVGVSPCFGGASAASEAQVLCEGFAYRIRANRLLAALGQHSALQELLLRYMRSLMAHAGWIAVCNRHHRIQQQLCRWLLGVLDRGDTSTVTLTHDVIANMLGVRRESVSLELRQLEGAGVIRRQRGQLTLLDRDAVAERACECHGAISREYDHLRPDLGKYNGAALRQAS